MRGTTREWSLSPRQPCRNRRAAVTWPGARARPLAAARMRGHEDSWRPTTEPSSTPSGRGFRGRQKPPCQRAPLRSSTHMHRATRDETGRFRRGRAGAPARAGDTRPPLRHDRISCKPVSAEPSFLGRGPLGHPASLSRRPRCATATWARLATCFLEAPALVPRAWGATPSPSRRRTVNSRKQSVLHHGTWLPGFRPIPATRLAARPSGLRFHPAGLHQIELVHRAHSATTCRTFNGDTSLDPRPMPGRFG